MLTFFIESALAPAKDLVQPICVTAAPISSTSSSSALLDACSAHDVSAAQHQDHDLCTVFAWYDPASRKFVHPPEDSLSSAGHAVRFLWNEAENLCVKDDVLCLRSSSESNGHIISNRLLVPYSLQEKAMLSVHPLPSSGHHGVDKSRHLAGQRFYCYGIHVPRYC